MSVMLLSTSLTAALVLASGIEVHSTSECPSREGIMAKLGQLSSGGAQDDVAWVEVAPPKLDGTTELGLRLVRPDASVVGERRLFLRGTCEEMADTVATVLAAWRAPPVAAAVRPPTPASETIIAPVAAPVAVQTWLGAGGGLAGFGGLAAAGTLELVVEGAASRMRARAAALAQTSRQLDFEPGSVSWRRTHAELGLGLRSRPGTHAYWQVSADADVLLGWLRASGHGYDHDRDQDAFEYGFGAGLRGERRHGAWAFWLEGRANLWPRPQRLTLWGSHATTFVPRFDALLVLGVSLLVR